MIQNIVLTGFMGTGKSLTSKELAMRLKRLRVSTDEWIEDREGKSIAKIFTDYGEKAFRQLEAEAVKALAGQEGLIIDCGGGVVLNPDNMKILSQNGLIFYLKSAPDIILQRTKNKKHRPLLNNANPEAKIKELLKEREPFYMRHADFTVDTSLQTPEETAAEILRLLIK